MSDKEFVCNYKDGGNPLNVLHFVDLRKWHEDRVIYGQR